MAHKVPGEQQMSNTKLTVQVIYNVHTVFHSVPSENHVHYNCLYSGNEWVRWKPRPFRWSHGPMRAHKAARWDGT